MDKTPPHPTQQYGQRHPDLTYVPLSDTGLWVSQAGFGSYRTVAGNETHAAALRQALTHGINLIDTSTNYGDGESEKLIGTVVGNLIAEKRVRREELVIVSKAGYLQGSNYTLARQRKAEGRPFPNILHIDEGLDHCIHPEFLADQLTRSLARLNSDYLDLFLLHNPEYYLTWAAKAQFKLPRAQSEYLTRLQMAFAYLETEVANGRIGSYGISSNTFPARRDNYRFTSLSMILNSGDYPHFKAIQLPMNLLETGAATYPNQADGRTVLQLAHDAGLAVLINRPLNAIRKETVTRLAAVLPPTYPATPQEVSTAVDSLCDEEIRLQQEVLPGLSTDEETRTRLWHYLAVGHMMQGQWRGFGTYQNWRDLQTQYLLPRADNAVQFLASQPNLPVEAFSWLNTYIEALNTTMAAVGAFYQATAATTADHIQETAVTADPDWQAETLSQTAVRALRTTQGVTAVLVGMRQPAYVDDVLQELRRDGAQKNRTGAWQKMHDM